MNPSLYGDQITVTAGSPNATLESLIGTGTLRADASGDVKAGLTGQTVWVLRATSAPSAPVLSATVTAPAEPLRGARLAVSGTVAGGWRGVRRGPAGGRGLARRWSD